MRTLTHEYAAGKACRGRCSYLGAREPLLRLRVRAKIDERFGEVAERKRASTGETTAWNWVTEYLTRGQKNACRRDALRNQPILPVIGTLCFSFVRSRKNRYLHACLVSTLVNRSNKLISDKNFENFSKYSSIAY